MAAARGALPCASFCRSSHEHETNITTPARAPGSPRHGFFSLNLTIAILRDLPTALLSLLPSLSLHLFPSPQRAYHSRYAALGIYSKSSITFFNHTVSGASFSFGSIVSMPCLRREISRRGHRKGAILCKMLRPRALGQLGEQSQPRPNTRNQNLNCQNQVLPN